MTAPHFKRLSSDAKILYGLMLDRMSLSMKNSWIDDENKVYIYFTLEDVMESLNCSHTTGVKIMTELDIGNGIGLIDRIKQGQGKPARIYVKNFNSLRESDNLSLENPDFKKVEVKTSRKEKSRLQESVCADFNILNANYIDLNNNKNSYTEYQSINQHQKSDPSSKVDSVDIIDSKEKIEKTEMIDTMETYRALIHQNIGYHALIERYDVEQLDEYVQIMLDAICTKSETVRVDRAEYPADVVKSRLLKLNYFHIEYVIKCMANNTTKIQNIKNYILTALYNSYATIDSFYRAEVNHDLYG